MKTNLFSYGDHYANPGSNLTCVEEDYHDMMLAYDCSCLRPLPNVTCNVNEIQEPKYIPIVLLLIFAIILFLLFFELVAIRFKHSFLDNFFGKLIFSMGIISSLVTQFCTMHYLQDDSNSIIIWYNVVLGGSSAFFIAFGFRFLFVKSPINNIGSHDKGMGLVVAIVTILVVVPEILVTFMVIKLENPRSYLKAMYVLYFACEKTVQAALYVAVRRCEPDPNYKRGAVFYFKFLSFLNFTLWLSSISFTDIPIYDEVLQNSFLHYVDGTYRALLIDYRLLCALLFLEHALAIDDDDDAHEHANIEVDSGFQMPRQCVHYTVIGVVIGLFFLAFEVINGLDVGHENLVNLFPILVDTALFVLGVLLLRNVDISVLHDKKVSLVFLMVTSMGAASIVYLFCFGLLSLFSFKYDEPVSYVRWSACVFFPRAISLLVLLVVYTGIPVSTIASWQNYNRKNYLYVSALCCGLFARFVGSILDEFKDTMHKTAHEQLHSKKLRPLQDLFELGPIFQLATILHLALHFLLLLRRLLYEQPNKQPTKDRLDAHGEPISGNYDARIRVINNYGAVNDNGVARQLNGNADEYFELSGAHSFEGDNNEHTRLLPPVDQTMLTHANVVLNTASRRQETLM